MKFLLNYSDDENVKQNNCNQAFICASFYCRLELMKFFLEQGANINAKDAYEKTALEGYIWKRRI